MWKLSTQPHRPMGWGNRTEQDPSVTVHCEQLLKCIWMSVTVHRLRDIILERCHKLLKQILLYKLLMASPNLHFRKYVISGTLVNYVTRSNILHQSTAERHQEGRWAQHVPLGSQSPGSPNFSTAKKERERDLAQKLCPQGNAVWFVSTAGFCSHRYEPFGSITTGNLLNHCINIGSWCSSHSCTVRIYLVSHIWS
jgi:hypothetical protein